MGVAIFIKVFALLVNDRYDASLGDYISLIKGFSFLKSFKHASDNDAV